MEASAAALEGAGRCALCGSEDSVLFLKAQNTHGSRRLSAETFSLMKCSGCGLVYVSPRPGAETIGRYYGENYYGGEGIKGFSEKVFARFSMAWKKRLVKRLQKTGQLLDVGSGDGSFISSFKKEEIRSFGVEPNKEGCRSAWKKGATAFNGDIFQCRFQSGRFDVVTMWHVLEHVHDPSSLLKEARRVLNDDGFFIVGVPNMGGAGFRAGRQSWFHLDLPRHLYHFDRHTAERMLAKGGFRVERAIYPFHEYPLDLYHTLMNALPEKRHTRLALGMPLLVTSLVLKPVLAFLRASETIILVCRKG